MRNTQLEMVKQFDLLCLHEWSLQLLLKLKHPPICIYLNSLYACELQNKYRFQMTCSATTKESYVKITHKEKIQKSARFRSQNQFYFRNYRNRIPDNGRVFQICPNCLNMFLQQVGKFVTHLPSKHYQLGKQAIRLFASSTQPVKLCFLIYFRMIIT